MLAIIGSSGRDCVLITSFSLYDPKIGGNLFWVGQYDPHPSYWKKN